MIYYRKPIQMRDESWVVDYVLHVFYGLSNNLLVVTRYGNEDGMKPAEEEDLQNLIRKVFTSRAIQDQRPFQQGTNWWLK